MTKPVDHSRRLSVHLPKPLQKMKDKIFGSKKRWVESIFKPKKPYRGKPEPSAPTDKPVKAREITNPNATSVGKLHNLISFYADQGYDLEDFDRKIIKLAKQVHKKGLKDDKMMTRLYEELQVLLEKPGGKGLVVKIRHELYPEQAKGNNTREFNIVQKLTNDDLKQKWITIILGPPVGDPVSTTSKKGTRATRPNSIDGTKRQKKSVVSRGPSRKKNKKLPASSRNEAPLKPTDINKKRPGPTLTNSQKRHAAFKDKPLKRRSIQQQLTPVVSKEGGDKKTDEKKSTSFHALREKAKTLTALDAKKAGRQRIVRSLSDFNVKKVVVEESEVVRNNREAINAIVAKVRAGDFQAVSDALVQFREQFLEKGSLEQLQQIYNAIDKELASGNSSIKSLRELPKKLKEQKAANYEAGKFIKRVKSGKVDKAYENLVILRYTNFPIYKMTKNLIDKSLSEDESLGVASLKKGVDRIEDEKIKKDAKGLFEVNVVHRYTYEAKKAEDGPMIKLSNIDLKKEPVLMKLDREIELLELINKSNEGYDKKAEEECLRIGKMIIDPDTRSEGFEALEKIRNEDRRLYIEIKNNMSDADLPDDNVLFIEDCADAADEFAIMKEAKPGMPGQVFKTAIQERAKWRAYFEQDEKLEAEEESLRKYAPWDKAMDYIDAKRYDLARGLLKNSASGAGVADGFLDKLYDKIDQIRPGAKAKLKELDQNGFEEL